MLFSTAAAMFPNCSNVISWKISLEEWSAADEFGLTIAFETGVPPKGKNIHWFLKIYPKGIESYTRESVFVGLGSLDKMNDSPIQFQIETGYRIRKQCETKSIDMSKLSPLSHFHSSLFDGFQLLGQSYDVGSVENRADGQGFLTFELEMKMYISEKPRFGLSIGKEMFVNRFEKLMSGRSSPPGDIKIVCGGKEFSFHKLLLISQPPVFDAMFTLDSKEEKEGCVTINDCSPEAVQEFKWFLYFAQLRPVRFSPNEIFDVIHLASKYQVDLLMDSCMDAMIDIMDVTNVLQMMVIVDKYDLGTCIADMVKEFMAENIKDIVDKEDWIVGCSKNTLFHI